MTVNSPARPISYSRRLKRLWLSWLWLVHLSRSARRSAKSQDISHTAKLMQQVSQQLLDALNVRVELHGKIPEDLNRLLVVANHTSWLDIFAMASVHPMQFIAKQEIKSWPVLGKIVVAMGTLFINRAQRKDTAKINAMITEELHHGGTVAFFPEARTSDGKGLRAFKGALFQAAIDSNSAVLPIALRYFNADGKRSSHAAFTDEVSLPKSFLTILSEEETVVRVDFTDVLRPETRTEDTSRFTLKQQAQQQVASLVLDDRDLQKLSEWDYL